jgi:hypothetical protein
MNDARKFLILSITSLLVIAAAFVGLSYTFIEVSSSSESSELELTKTGKSESKKIKPGTHFVRNGSYTIESRDGNKETKKTFATSLFHIKKIDVDFRPQQTLHKVASGASDCLVGRPGDIEKGEVMSYDCVTPTTLIKNSFSTEETATRIAGYLDDVFAVQTYQDGLAGLREKFSEDEHKTESHSSKLLLSYIDAGKITKEQELSNWVKKTSRNQLRLLADREKLYILDIPSKQILIFASVEESPTIKKLAIDDKDWSENVTMRRSGDATYLFVAQPEEGSIEEIGRGILFKVPDSGQSSVQKVEVEDFADKLGDFQASAGGVIVATGLDQILRVFTIDSDKLILSYSIPEVESAKAINGNLYFINDGKVYVFDLSKQSSYLVFGSSKTKISSITQLNDLVVLNGYNNIFDDQPVNQTFLLKDKPYDGSTRLQDILPYSNSADNLPLTNMDYLGNTIMVNLSLQSLQVNRQTGAQSYSANEFNEASGKIRSVLKRDGITEDRYSIQFKPY